MAKVRRGIGVTTAAVLAVVLVIAIASYIYLNIFRTATIPLDPLIAKLDSYLSEKLLMGPTLGGFYLVNTGNIPITLDYVILQDPHSRVVTLVRAGRNQLCSEDALELQPGGTSLFICGNNLVPIAVVTSSGRVFVRDPRLTSPYLVPKSITQRLLLSPEIVTEIGKYLNVVDDIVNTSPTMVLHNEWFNTYVVLEANVSLVVATRTPGALDMWNILIVGYGNYGPKPNSRIVSPEVVNLSKVGYYRFRIKLENFTGTIEITGTGGKREVLTAPRIVPYLVDRGKQYFVYLQGSAGRVAVYTASKVNRGFMGLDPYYIFGDLDGNSYPELITITQDFSVGNSTKVNDVFPPNIQVADSFLNPVRIVFTSEPINNSRYAIALLSVRFFFWDSSEDDISDNDNRVIVRVGIYDNQSSMYVYSVSLSYYELCRYRTVKPMTLSYIVKDFLLYIPSPDELGLRDLYVAIEIVDPFDVQGVRNDTEIIIGIEYVGLVLGVRI